MASLKIMLMLGAPTTPHVEEGSFWTKGLKLKLTEFKADLSKQGSMSAASLALQRSFKEVGDVSCHAANSSIAVRHTDAVGPEALLERLKQWAEEWESSVELVATADGDAA
mmetsp:Transcript_82256/g.266628  ORF Transcript_82256/g.266628 Transcript_82256/m.266628 type:complete len:111 (-) Transcript_82256:254-586(-)